MGFDFYATDLVLSARAQAFESAVLNAPCHHNPSWAAGAVPEKIVRRRFSASAGVFAGKWLAQFPLHTPCWPFVDMSPLPLGSAHN